MPILRSVKYCKAVSKKIHRSTALAQRSISGYFGRLWFANARVVLEANRTFSLWDAPATFSSSMYSHALSGKPNLRSLNLPASEYVVQIDKPQQMEESVFRRLFCKAQFSSIWVEIFRLLTCFASHRWPIGLQKCSIMWYLPRDAPSTYSLGVLWLKLQPSGRIRDYSRTDWSSISIRFPIQ